jgi:predicted secreted hydrolase
MGAHPSYRTEWWYYTGQLTDERGRTYGYELTFFRTGLSPASPRGRSAWAARDLLFAHFAVADVNGRRFAFDERASRAAIGLAGAEAGRQHVWVRGWSTEVRGGRHFLSASQPGWELELNADALKPPALHGQRGFSRKGAGTGHASLYYSLTRLRTWGTLRCAERPLAVTGESWMDHEFSTDSLAPDEVGWDWFGLQLSTGEELMVYRMRRRNGTLDPKSGGTWVPAQGGAAHLRAGDCPARVRSRWRSPRTGITYPQTWTLTLPRLGGSLEVTPLLPDQELRTGRSTGVTYWEGAVTVRGTLRGRSVTGRGYVELTGYGGPLLGRT